MDNIALPKNIEYKTLKENKTEITIEPLFPGYGITLANSLRRVLLSSIMGAAVTKVKIKGVSHEFSSLPSIKEDVVELLLNIKKLKLQIFSDEPVKFKLKTSGEKVVTAKDIEKNSQVEISNPELVIATLTDKKSELDIEFTAEKGMGYVTVEEKSGYENLAVNEISLDSLFSPIENVSFNIEAVRVGKKTDYEKLVMKVQSDGTISPEEAINKSINVLINHFSLISKEEVKKETKKETKKPVKKTAKKATLKKEVKKTAKKPVKKTTKK